jgi:hypothetical protein
MLAWMYEKLIVWTDDYPWTPSEIITWTMLHYLPGPTTAMYMYRDNAVPLVMGIWWKEKIQVPYAISAFPKEVQMTPRSWIETQVNLKFYREHSRGGHFAMWERPDEIIDDMLELYRSVLDG